MGFMDKVTAQATTLAGKAQETIKEGQAKLEHGQAAQHQEALLRDLGAQVFLDRTGRGTPETSAEIERLLAELREGEAEGLTVSGESTANPPEPHCSPHELWTMNPSRV